MKRRNSAHSEGSPAFAQAAELELRGVSKRYAGQQQPAIHELSLTVPAGTQTISVSAGQKACHVGTTDGPQDLAVTVSAGATLTVDAFCGHR